MKDHIKVAHIGTQYDPEEVVCITDGAKELLTNALYAEINALKNVIETGSADRFWDVEDGDPFAKEREKLKLAERLMVQLDDMKVCE